MEKSKTSFSKKVNLQTKTLLVEKANDLNDPEISSEVEKVISDDTEIAETFNEFFVNIVPSLKISPKENYKTDVGNDNEQILNYINKFKNHPSIKVIKSRKKEEQTFTFNYVSYEEVLNEIRKLQTTKTTQQNDIPTKILKENSEVFARYFHKNINFCIENSIFPSDLKVADVTPAFKKKSDPLAFYLIYLKYMKDVFTTKCRLTLVISYLSINVDFAKDLMHNTA